MGHAHAEEAVGVLLLHFDKVVVLVAVDDFLHDDGSAHLGIVHVGKKYLGCVLALDHEWRHHLHFFVHEDAPSVGEGEDAFAVDPCVLFEPEVGVCVYYCHDCGRLKVKLYWGEIVTACVSAGVGYELAQLTRFWSPMICCTFSTSVQSGSSLAQAMLRLTLSGLAEEKSVPAMRGLLTEYCTASFSMG